jgi:AhpD family alkylhydroperoxidase
MSDDAKAFYGKWKSDMERMKQETPGVVQGFGALFAKVMGEGALTVKEKEFIAVGIAVALHCVPCINLHVQKCLELGASKEQVLEAAAVGTMMGGGPAYTHIPVVLDALAALEK